MRSCTASGKWTPARSRDRKKQSTHRPRTSVSTLRRSLLLGANFPRRAPLASIILMQHLRGFVRTKPGYLRSKMSCPTSCTCGALQRMSRKASTCSSNMGSLPSTLNSSKLSKLLDRLVHGRFGASPTPTCPDNAALLASRTEKWRAG